jgi:hypothetical protein
MMVSLEVDVADESDEQEERSSHHRPSSQSYTQPFTRLREGKISTLGVSRWMTISTEHYKQDHHRV